MVAPPVVRPWDQLAEMLTAEAVDVGFPLTVYAVPAASMKAPGILIQPDDPWREPFSFDHYLERYVAIGFVVASDSPSAYRQLARLVDLILTTIPFDGGSWDWDSASAPRLDESTGSVYLAAAVPLTLKVPIP